MPIDLSGIKKFVDENLFVDTVSVTRDTDLTEDEAWDAETMQYTGGDPDDAVYAGEGYISPDRSQPLTPTIGGSENVITRYYLNVPLGTPDFFTGDEVTVTTSANMPELVDEVFTIIGDEVGSYKVKRKWRMTRTIPTRFS